MSVLGLFPAIRPMTRLSVALRETLWLEQGRNCHYCREPIELVDVTFDHIVPRTFGGPTARWNLVASCKPCNGELADATRKCVCKKCKRALNRFHIAKARRPTVRAELIPVGSPNPKTQAELIKLLRARRERMRRKLNSLEDHDSLDAAALGGKLRAYTEVLDLIDGVDTGRWEDALAQVVVIGLGEAGIGQARQLYKDGKTR